MNDDDFSQKINRNDYTFQNDFFDCKFSLSDLFRKSKQLATLTFIDCTFEYNLDIQNIKDDNLTVVFHKCTFKNILVTHCKINKLGFFNTKTFEKLEISNSTFDELFINGKQKHKDAEVNIVYTNISSNMNCYGLNIKKGNFLDLNYDNENAKNSYINFNDTSFENLYLQAYLGKTSSFTNLKTITSDFSHCIFGETNFNKVNFEERTNFHECIFNSIVNFRESLNKGSVRFLKSHFKNQSYFDGSNFSNLTIMHSLFEKKASFDKLEVGSIDLFQTTFNEGVFFDELKINKLNDQKFLKTWKPEVAKQWRRTLRQIKQELQKSDNRIDYNRFRAYELSAYYQELNWNWNDGFKDKAILWATKHVTGFDHSWRKALRFTLVASFIFYTLFFISENYMHQIDLRFIREFLSGSFRFLLVTDFYNPLSDGRNYIDATNTIGWFIFILGKIVIAFGIYEMIQAFRKFKA